jgi:hypothetical protein
MARKSNFLRCCTVQEKAARLDEIGSRNRNYQGRQARTLIADG